MVENKGWLRPSKVANDSQEQMILRKYGLFIHFVINTFNDIEWSDGTLDVQAYNPTNIDTDNWAQCAKKAGMKYVILTAKHHDGFCLWPSDYTDYSIQGSPLKIDVVQSLSDSCRKVGIKLGLYYSLWDRHEKSYDDHAAYVNFMVNQLKELLTSYGPICELWLDGGWEKKREAWDIPSVYECVKKCQPDCSMGVNWTIGLPEDEDAKVFPADQQEGFPFRYFPSDFRLGDPYLPSDHDPKIFSHEGKSYYLPFESTVCLNEKWFFSPHDSELKGVEELKRIYQQATAQDNILIFNSPPNLDGVMPIKNVKRLTELRSALGLG